MVSPNLFRSVDKNKISHLIFRARNSMSNLPSSSKKSKYNTFISASISKFGRRYSRTGLLVFLGTSILSMQLSGTETYRFRSLRCELAKKRSINLSWRPRSRRRFWLMHSSPRPLDLASAIPAMKTSLEDRSSSWNRTQSNSVSISWPSGLSLANSPSQWSNVYDSCVLNDVFAVWTVCSSRNDTRCGVSSERRGYSKCGIGTRVPVTVYFSVCGIYCRLGGTHSHVETCYAIHSSHQGLNVSVFHWALWRYRYRNIACEIDESSGQRICTAPQMILLTWLSLVPALKSTKHKTHTLSPTDSGLLAQHPPAAKPSPYHSR